jgi:hypothetical protein
MKYCIILDNMIHVPHVSSWVSFMAKLGVWRPFDWSHQQNDFLRLWLFLMCVWIPLGIVHAAYCTMSHIWRVLSTCLVLDMGGPTLLARFSHAATHKYTQWCLDYKLNIRKKEPCSIKIKNVWKNLGEKYLETPLRVANVLICSCYDVC